MFDKLKKVFSDIIAKKKNKSAQKQALEEKRKAELLRLFNSNIVNEQELVMVLNAMRNEKWYTITVLNKEYTINKERDGEYNIKGIKKDYYRVEIIAKLLKRPMPKDKHGKYLKG